MASPMSTTRPVVLRSFGGTKSLSSSCFRSELEETPLAMDLNGSAQVSAKALISSTLASVESGKSRGPWCPFQAKFSR